MCKAIFSKLVKAMRNEKPVIVKTDNFKWFLCWEVVNNDFRGFVERESKNGKELYNYYFNSIGFFDKIMRIAEIKNLQLTDTDRIDHVILK